MAFWTISSAGCKTVRLPNLLALTLASDYFHRIDQVLRLVDLTRPLFAGIEPDSHEIPDFIVRAVRHLSAELVPAEHQAHPRPRRHRLLEQHARSRRRDIFQIRHQLRGFAALQPYLDEVRTPQPGFRAPFPHSPTTVTSTCRSRARLSKSHSTICCQVPVPMRPSVTARGTGRCW